MGSLLEGKVAVITGSGRGIGRAHAIAMAAQKAMVVVNDTGGDRRGHGCDRSPADEVVATIRAQGGKAVANYDSVASADGASAIIKAAVDNFGRLDILVNNAGVHIPSWSWEMADEVWDIVVKVNLYGTFYCSREATKIFRQQQSGRIINTSSLAGFGSPEMCNYAAAKEGVVGLTRTLARELGSYGATVNCIRPAAGTREAESSEWMERLTKRVGREKAESLQAAQMQLAPEGCSALVVFLASGAADNVNGCVFRVKTGRIGLYRDPPYVEGTIWKDGNWTPEELVRVLPSTLTAGMVSQGLPSWGSGASTQSGY
jgi:3-oxoacyl-[acyl-carrier protein] reductase